MSAPSSLADSDAIRARTTNNQKPGAATCGLRDARRGLHYAGLNMGSKILFRALAALTALPGAFAQTVVTSGIVAPTGGTTDIWHFIKAGGIVMIPLGVLSVLALMLIIIYFFTLRRGAIATGRYMKTADALLRKGDYYGLLAVSNRHGEAVARIMRRTLDFLTKNPTATVAEAREIAETEGTRQAAGLQQQIVYLADIGTIAPMVGLFGTVLGMIKSFSVVAADVTATKPMLLAAGVSEALVATAGGLLVGIPAMAAYAYYRGRTQRLIAELEAATTQLISQLGVHYKPGGVQPHE
ncbi:MAG: MotA/TolQ/ExbB proton channel family protein [Terrimicrobiaceae bacterium]|nr:MotA/TolQ/ExbB proton channel family protein [Terrimicrobiaceae bacterium]